MADYMLRKGYNTSAKKLAESTGTSLLIDDSLFSECAAIEASLEKRNATDALAWCKENQSALKRINVSLSNFLLAL